MEVPTPDNSDILYQQNESGNMTEIDTEGTVDAWVFLLDKHLNQ